MKRSALIAALERALAQHNLEPAPAGALALLLDALEAPEAPTSVHDPRVGLDVHIADSLSGFAIAELRHAGVIADLGSGGGLPGLVIAAVRSDARVFLVESLRRKCAFLRDTAIAMGMTNVEVVEARAESWSAGCGICDVVTARALAPLPVLCEYAAPLLDAGGLLVAWKGEVPAAEADDAAAAAQILGLSETSSLPVRPYAGSERHVLWIARKVAPTPSNFPRRPGMATKRPLSVKNLR